VSNINKAIESQKQFVDRATKLCENNRLLNTILRMEMIVKQYSGFNKRFLLNLFLPVASLVFWQLRRTIDEGYPQGKDFLVDMLYCDKLLLKINWIVWIGYILSIIWIFIFGGVDQRFSELFTKVFIAFMIFYIVTLYPLIEMLESFNQLKIEMIGANQASLENSTELLKQTNDGIIDNEKIAIDFQAKQQIGALASELAKIEYEQRSEVIATMSKRYLPMELKTEEASFLTKKLEFFFKNKDANNTYREEADKENKQFLNDYKNAVGTLGENPVVMEYTQNIRNHGINNPDEIIVSIGHDILRNLHRRVDEVERSYNEKQYLRESIKGISKLVTQFQYDPENAMKYFSLDELFTKYLKIMTINKDGSIMINIENIENMSSSDRRIDLSGSTLKGVNFQSPKSTATNTEINSTNLEVNKLLSSLEKSLKALDGILSEEDKKDVEDNLQGVKEGLVTASDQPGLLRTSARNLARCLNVLSLSHISYASDFTTIVKNLSDLCGQYGIQIMELVKNIQLPL
jgi:HAMP domain-containing protein